MGTSSAPRKEGRLLSWCASHLFVLIFAFASCIYLLTMDRSASWWDCGEFIATGWTLSVGHPPGAPFYQLVTHLVMLLSFGNPMLVAPLSNAVSALCGGLTVALLYMTLRELNARRLGSLVGALCYLFCDTAWFSAVESEVYSMAMLFCSLDVYVALCYRRSRNLRLLPLLGLLLGLGVGMHLMTLLVLPAVGLIVIASRPWPRRANILVLSLIFFLLGLTPYAVIPLRAAANPPINELGKDFASYLRREQYEKAPLYPRMWRQRDTAHWDEWNAHRTDLLGNAVYYTTYQLGYMYGRYLMYNFLGRANLAYREADGFSLFNFKYSLFILPGLIGLWGLLRHRRRSRLGFWVVLLMFLFGGLILNLYLNHPCYEPRERDYVYILSFYAFALWIGIGADELATRRPARNILLLLAPLLMAVGNWPDHDRSRCHSVHDIALNHLECCDQDAILITLGDNDTFPLWYLQQVEGRRTDVSVYNVGLTGWSNIMKMLEENDMQRPVYFSHFFYQRHSRLFADQLRCEGFCWRLLPAADGQPPAAKRHPVEWHITRGEYIDPVSRIFLDIWQQNTGRAVPRR